MTANEQRNWRVRPAVRADVVEIDRLVRELAVYEREPDAVEAEVTDFEDALFGESPRVFCHVAELADGTVAGIAVWYETFSTWKGRHGIWLEDLFVSPRHRGLGLGRALLATLATLCAERGYPRLEWWVLAWNTPSIAFYESLGATAQDDWTVYRLDGAALDRVGHATPDSAPDSVPDPAPEPAPDPSRAL